MQGHAGGQSRIREIGVEDQRQSVADIDGCLGYPMQ